LHGASAARADRGTAGSGAHRRGGQARRAGSDSSRRARQAARDSSRRARQAGGCEGSARGGKVASAQFAELAAAGYQNDADSSESSSSSSGFEYTPELRYFQPSSGTTKTTLPSSMSWATRTAIDATAPAEPPVKRPSSARRRLVQTTASRLETKILRSSNERSRIGGM